MDQQSYQLVTGSSLSSARAYQYLLHDLDKDQERQLENHLHAGDYFGTLATVLTLLHESGRIKDDSTFEEILDELTFLQEHYDITKKQPY